MLIGLLGGSFNPPHQAHLVLAQAAVQQLGLARVDLLPAGQPWQKSATSLASASDRLAMCERLVKDCPQLGVEACEVNRTGPTYTVDTLAALRAAHPSNRYVLILGADQAANFATWRNWQGVLDQCTLAMAARQGQAASLPSEVMAYLAAHQMQLRTIAIPAMPISATRIRQALASNQFSTLAELVAHPNLAQALPTAVARYIIEHSLYSPTQ